MSDYEIDQIRRVRHQISAENEHDPRKLTDYYRRIEKELRESRRFKFADEMVQETAPHSAAPRNMP